jgi:hypothetical protein
MIRINLIKANLPCTRHVVVSSGHFTTLLSPAGQHQRRLLQCGVYEDAHRCPALMAVAITAFLAASVYSGIGAGLGAYDPGPLSLLRLLSASAALAVYALLSRRVRLPAVRDLPATALSA